MQLRNRDVFEAATYPANKVLVRIHIRVEPSDCSGRTYFANQVFAFEELQSAIDSSLRQPGQLLAQPAVNGFCRRMSEIFSQCSINRQPLSRDSNAS